MTTKILLVDDEPDMEMLIKRRFRKEIEAEQFAFIYAVNGVDALAKLQMYSDLDILLTDINMPEMDGLTLLGKLNEMHSPIKAVIISAYGDMDNIRTAMNRGAFDFITKPINFDDLTLTIDKTIRFVQQQKENLRVLEDHHRLSEELRIATAVQRKLLPASRPSIAGLDVCAVNRPAMEIGGDYYDFLFHADYDLGVVIADVAGKGTSAAFYMAEIKGIIHAFSKSYPSPKDLFKHTNKVLCSHLSKNVFITAACGMFRLNKKSLSFSRAGHCPLIHYSAKSNRIQAFNPKGLGLGIDNGNIFEPLMEEIEISFGPDDVFVFYTDGLCEAENGNHEEYGHERLMSVVMAKGGFQAERISEEILKDITAFVKQPEQRDDITLVVIKINPQKN